MTTDIEIRETLPSDVDALEAFYREVFPDEDLVPLVKDLLQEKSGVLSLAAIVGGKLAGHVVFTACGVDGTTDGVALLGPLGVSVSLQKQGIGSALVEAGHNHLRDTKAAMVCVLGDPAYYGRFGFKAEDHVAPPYPLPEEWHGAWQSLYLQERAEPVRGTLTVPRPWRSEALWVE